MSLVSWRDPERSSLAAFYQVIKCGRVLPVRVENDESGVDVTLPVAVFTFLFGRLQRPPDQPSYARRPVTNAYATVELLKSSGALNITGTAIDARLRLVIEGVSRQIDAYCNRHFFELSATRKFDTGGGQELLLPDLVSIDANGLKTDDDKDRTFETTWAATDYLEEPANADPAGGHDLSRPLTRISVDAAAGTKSAWPAGRQTVQISGNWGFWRRLLTAAETLNEVLDATETGVDVSSRTDIEAGHTILIGAEQMYVQSYSANTLTVVRGANGTTTATHSTSAAISVYQYPSPVGEATLLQAARLWKRKDSPVLGADHSLDARRVAVLDPDVTSLLSSYRRLGVEV